MVIISIFINCRFYQYFFILVNKQILYFGTVLNELDGLAHGRRDSSARPEHLAMVTECAASALEFLRSRSSPAIRCVTTKGTILNSATFTSEEDCQVSC